MANKQKIEKLIKKSLLAAIKNSVGIKTFRNFYARIDGKEVDVMENGSLSCAYFVSGILTMGALIKRTHATVDVTVQDMIESGWKKMKKPEEGDVIVWEAQQFGKEHHKHIGFYIGNNQAISNSDKAGAPVIHDWQFSGKRKIEAIYTPKEEILRYAQNDKKK